MAKHDAPRTASENDQWRRWRLRKDAETGQDPGHKSFAQFRKEKEEALKQARKKD